MKIRTVGKIGAFLSVFLFCIGVAFYGFAKLRDAEEGKDMDLLSLVPSDCMGVLETDNLDLLADELPQTAYSDKMDSVYAAGLLPVVFNDLVSYAGESTHGVGNYMGRLMVSFHSPEMGKSTVVYFTTNMSGSKFFGELLKKKGIDFIPKEEKYRGKKIVIFPVRDGDFLSVYSGHGFVTASYQKSLIEKVIDAEKDGTSLRKDRLFNEAYHNQTANFMTVYARTPLLPLLANGQETAWSEFDIHLNSEVFYLNGSIYLSAGGVNDVADKLSGVKPVVTDSLLVLSDSLKLDSCISLKSKLASPTLFDECVQNLSPDVLYTLVVDMDGVMKHPEAYKEYLPAFVFDHLFLFRSFILSLQVTRSGGNLSHLLVFTYKD